VLKQEYLKATESTKEMYAYSASPYIALHLLYFSALLPIIRYNNVYGKIYRGGGLPFTVNT